MGRHRKIISLEDLESGRAKIPRSQRECYVCGHLYSSHSGICLKIVQTKPVKKECDCKQFIKDRQEWEFIQANKEMFRKKREEEEAKKLAQNLLNAEKSNEFIFKNQKNQ
jgi:hypothetical protein